MERFVAAAVVFGASAGVARGEGGGPFAGFSFDAGEAVQITFPADYLKAGEAYFSPDGRHVVFQAIERPEAGEAPGEHYAMYVAPLVLKGGMQSRAGSGVVGLGDAMLLSAPGSANTCGFFHPTERGRVIFGSTVTPPVQEARAGYQRGTRSYRWAFPNEMEVVGASFDTRRGASSAASPLWTRDGYDAECAYDPSGRWIVYTRVDPETGDGDLWVFDTTDESHTELVTEKGYDGGPFFSPDGKRICYRSDRAGNDLLQVYVADLAFGADGRIAGISREYAVTANRHVNWAPFWHPSGRFLVYSTSEVGHDNYEVFAVEAPRVGDTRGPGELASKRITDASGFDGLPVFSNDGKWMMWTSQRGGMFGDETRPSSQLWIAPAR